MTEPMLALSLVQPMAWGIGHAGKHLENRIWPQLRRGLDGLAKVPTMGGRRIRPGELFAIHASAKRKPPDGYIKTACYAADLVTLPPAAAMTSAVVAVARIVDVVRTAPAESILPNDRGESGIDLAGWQRLVERFGLERARLMARWFAGPFALVLDDIVALEQPVVDVRGALYFWELQPEHDRAVRAQLAP